MDLFKVDNKCFLVTGGTSGIGRMIVTGLVEEGARVYTCARSKDSCAALEAELANRKGKCTAIPCDITKMAEIDHLVSFIKKSEPGGLNVLINNAGRMYNEPLESHSSEEFSKDIELNLISLFVVSQRFIPMLAQAASERNPSRIINISSIQGIQTNRGNNFGYSTSKAAVISLTKTLASKLSFQNILVNSIAPGIFPSEMTKPLLENFHDRVVSKVPLKRLGSTHDILGAVVYLSSEASSFVTGVTIPVDGGSLANCKL